MLGCPRKVWQYSFRGHGERGRKGSHKLHVFATLTYFGMLYKMKRFYFAGNGFILKDVMVDSLLGQELQVASPAVTSSGTYRCVADNSYRDVMSSSSLEARVSVTGGFS